MTSMEVNFFTVDSSGVIVATCGFLTKCFWLTAANKIVKVENIQVIECLLAVPAAEDVQIIANFVT